MSWFSKGHVITGLNAAEVDVIVQKLAKREDMWFDFDRMSRFDIIAKRWWTEERGHYVTYRLYFSKSAWKSLQVHLSDHEIEDLLLERGE